MKYLVILLVALAVSNGQQCTEDRAEACIENLLGSLLDDTAEEEVCKELTTSVNCLRSTVEECLGDGADEDIQEGLQELEKVLKDNCNAEKKEDEDEDMKQCFEANEDYIYECIYEGSTQALTLMMDQGGDLDENALTCAMYAMMSACFVERINEKCGQKAADLVEEEMKDVPQDIQEACEASEEQVAHTFQLLDKKKRK